MRKHLTMLVAAIIAAGSLIGTASAQASDASVRAAIHKAGKQLKASPELKAAVKEVKNEKASSGKIAKAKALFAKLSQALEGAAETVSAQHASTAAGKQGETLWLAGNRKLKNDAQRAFWETAGKRLLTQSKGAIMGDRKQRAEGKAKELKGHLKREAGAASGRGGTESRGAAEEAAGKAKQAVGKARSAVKKATR